MGRIVVRSPLTSDGPPAGGGGGLLTGWIADYRAQLANQGYEFTPAALARAVDTVASNPRWFQSSGDGWAKRVHTQVIPGTAGPVLNWLNIEHREGGNEGPNDDGGWCQGIKDSLPVPEVGQHVTVGFGEAYTMPSDRPTVTNHNHGTGAGIVNPTWEFCDSFWIPDNVSWVNFFQFGDNSAPNRDWGLWANGRLDDVGSNNSTGQTLFTKNHNYEFQLQIARLGATTGNAFLWAFDLETSPRTLIAGPGDWWNSDHTVNLGSLPVLTFDFATLQHLVAGSNGVNGTWTTPLPHKRMTMFRDVLGQVAVGEPLPAYGGITDGVQPELAA